VKREVANGVAMALGIVLLVGIVGAAPWLVGEARRFQSAGRPEARSGQRIVTLDVGGMTCAGCAAKIQGELAALPGVSEVAVRLPQRRAYVVCAPTVADTTITAAVSRAGPGFLAAVARD